MKLAVLLAGSLVVLMDGLKADAMGLTKVAKTDYAMDERTVVLTAVYLAVKLAEKMAAWRAA